MRPTPKQRLNLLQKQRNVLLRQYNELLDSLPEGSADKMAKDKRIPPGSFLQALNSCKDGKYREAKKLLQYVATHYLP